MHSPEFKNAKMQVVLVTEAPAAVDLAGAYRWEEFRRKGEPTFVNRQKEDPASIVYSSGTGGRPKGCVLTHENYLEQCRALTAWYPFWPGVRYLSILPTNHAIDFMVGFIGPFVCGACVVHLRTCGRSSCAMHSFATGSRMSAWFRWCLRIWSTGSNRISPAFRESNALC